MSEHQLFVFVEGKKFDPYFYGNLCKKACLNFYLSYKIFNSEQIPTNSTGKTSLKEFYDFLKNKSSLRRSFKGKKYAILFFLDKDIDDFLKSQIKSNHIIYTSFYSVENHIFNEGDIHEGSAAAASMDPQEMINAIEDTKEWLATVAVIWKEWVKLCVFVRLHAINCPCNYGRNSQINMDLTGEVDKTKYIQYLEIVKTSSGLLEDEFKSRYNSISNYVDVTYANGEHDKLFKGKWYQLFLEQKLIEIANHTSANLDGLGKRLISHIANTLDFEESWTDHFTVPAIKMIEKLSN